MKQEKIALVELVFNGGEEVFSKEFCTDIDWGVTTKEIVTEILPDSVKVLCDAMNLQKSWIDPNGTQAQFCTDNNSVICIVHYFGEDEYLPQFTEAMSAVDEW